MKGMYVCITQTLVGCTAGLIVICTVLIGLICQCWYVVNTVLFLHFLNSTHDSFHDNNIVEMAYIIVLL